MGKALCVLPSPTHRWLLSGRYQSMPRIDDVKATFMAIFSAVDKDGSGALDKKEIKDAMMTMAKHAGGAAPIPADAETIDAGLKEMFGAIDGGYIDGDDTYNFD